MLAVAEIDQKGDPAALIFADLELAAPRAASSSRSYGALAE